VARLPIVLFVFALAVTALTPAAALSAPGDFDADGYSDLAIGVPRDDRGDSGRVNVLYGSQGGLSAQGDQLWSYSHPAEQIEAFPYFGYAVATGDFNGDGFADLAAGAPGSDIGTTEETHEWDVGAVTVIYGGTEGLAAAGMQFWDQNVPGIEGEATYPDGFGTAPTAGDFNGDGFEDLAIGVQHDSIGGVAATGAVNVIYGSASGLTVAGNQLWHQDVEGVPDENEESDRFGGAVAAGDFNDDGFEDLAVGAPHEDLTTQPDTGAVTIIYGSLSGLQADGSQFLRQIKWTGGRESHDHFGSSLAVANFGRGLNADLAVGVPGEDFGSIRDAGGVAVFYSGTGASPSGGFWRQGTNGIGGHAEAGDEFGSAVAAADFGKGMRADLAVGVPGEDADSGAVNVIYAGRWGLSAAGNERWHQDRSGIASSTRPSDRFGLALAAGNFDGASRADLAIAVPREHIGGVQRAGAVHVLHGGEHGLRAGGSQFWHQNRPGVLGTVMRNDFLGFSLAPPGSLPFDPTFFFLNAL
jgi:FG-GAP repeat